MARVKTSPPLCKACDKPLRKRTYHETISEGAPDPTKVDAGMDWERAVVAVTRRKKLVYYTPPMVQVTVWCGEWGDYGDGHFCGITCGHRWAVRYLKGEA